LIVRLFYLQWMNSKIKMDKIFSFKWRPKNAKSDLAFVEFFSKIAKKKTLLHRAQSILKLVSSIMILVTISQAGPTNIVGYHGEK
jgi:hypothetical protein